MQVGLAGEGGLPSGLTVGVASTQTLDGGTHHRRGRQETERVKRQAHACKLLRLLETKPHKQALGRVPSAST